MSLSQASVSSMRVLRAIAEYGSFTEASRMLGYTQSAVSRQMASLERAAGAQLVERGPGGTRLTAAGHTALSYVAVALDALDAAGEDLAGRPSTAATVRVGWFATAGAVIVPRALTALRRSQPEITVRTREGGTPTLVRSVRAGSLDLALISQSFPFRAPDDVRPALRVNVIAERALRIAVPRDHPFAVRTDGVGVAELEAQTWIGGGDPTSMGVWPGLSGRPVVAHKSRDWLAKLQLVAAGVGITTVPAALIGMLPPSVVAVEVSDGPTETRRIATVRLDHAPGAAVRIVERTLHDAVARF